MRRTRSLLIASVALALPLSLVAVWGPTATVVGAEDTKARKAAEKMLRSKVAEERERAVAALEELGWNRNVGKALLEALEDDDWGVKIRAIEAIGRIGTKDAKEELEEIAVEGRIFWVRDAAIRALMGADAEASAEQLLERARHERDEAVEARALRAAGRLGSDEHLSAFGTFMRGKDLLAVEAACEAVGDIASRHDVADDAYAMLESELSRRHEHREFRAYRAAVLAIGRLDSDRARDTLVREVLAQENMDEYLPERVGRAFAAMDGAAVAKALEKGLEGARKVDQRRLLARLVARSGHVEAAPVAVGMLADDNVRVRAEAVRALRMIDARDHADAVRERLSDREWMVRSEAVTALATLIEPGAFRALAPEIQKDDAGSVRLEYVVALADLRDHEAIPQLVPFAADDNWRVSSAALATIGTLGIADDLPLLTEYFEHKDWRIRAAALEAAGRLRAIEAVPHLIEALGDRDPVPEGVALANLQILSGQKDIGDDARKWRKWWEDEGSGIELVKQSRQTDAQKRLAELRAERNAAYGTKEAVEILQKSRILVQLDSWDHVEIVLEHLEIPHTALRAQQLKEAGLNPNQVLLVNCAGNMDRDAMERVRWFVNVGGYVMTTDWALTKTVMPCFPGYMEQYSKSSTGNDVVVVEDASPGHELTAGIFGEVPALQWWLEIQAFPITIVYPERCNVIVDSAEMKERYGSSPMATEFRWGLGRVQHSLSHFYLQEEGMEQAREPLERKIFAADHLGLSLQQIRELERSGAFEGGLDADTMKEIAPDYSMFRIIVNMIAEKSDWVENL